MTSCGFRPVATIPVRGPVLRDAAGVAAATAERERCVAILNRSGDTAVKRACAENGRCTVGMARFLVGAAALVTSSTESSGV